MPERPHQERWPELDLLLDELLDLPADKRDARLRELTTDPALHSVVVEMLAAGSDRESFLEEGALALASEGLEDVVNGERSRIGPYRLLERLGAGGMGEVWLAERDDELLRQKVAVKLLQPLAGFEGVERFHTERQILGALRHDGIAKILDAGTGPGATPYLVLEYVDGSEITEHSRARDLDLDARLRLFVDVCNAVAYAHRRFIVHRDLKPSNVLVTNDGRVKLVDFGIAKLLDPTAIGHAAVPLTRTGLFLMTPEYAAPEQIRGETITTATDVYGLGVLLYELLTGRRPFELGGRSASEIERIVCQTEPEKPSTTGREDAPTRTATGAWRKRLRGDLDTIVLKAMRKEPEERYDTVQDLADDIRSFREGRPVAARPATLRYRTGKFVRRHRFGLAAAAVVVAALIAGLGGTLWQTREAELQEARFDSTGEFLFALFEQVDPDLNPGSQLTAVSLLDIGAARLERFAAGPEARADLLRVLGVLYSKLGERERGEELLRQAVSEAKTHLSPENNTIGQALNSLGSYLAERGKLTESEQVLRQSMSAFAVAGESGHWALGAGRDLARTQVQQGRWQEAVRALEENIEAHERLLVSDRRNFAQRSKATALALLGELQTDLDRWPEAKNNLQRAATIARQRLGESHPLLGRCLESLGRLHLRLGDQSAAEALLREALAVRRQAFPVGHHTTARTLSRLAAIRAEQGETSDAGRLYEESRRLWQVLPEGTHSERADRFRAQSALSLLQDRPEVARSSQLVALEARRLAHGSMDHWRVAEEIHRLGLIEIALGQPSRAEQQLEIALQMRIALFGTAHSAVDESRAALASLR